MADAWNPQQYEKFKNERSAPFFDLMSLVEKRRDMRVVDLGCGTGELTAQLHRHLEARETCGVDSSREMLMKATSVASSRGVGAQGALWFEEADIQTWNGNGEERNSYDLVFSNAALQWCEAHAELFGRFRDALRAHGQIAIQMPMNQDYPTHTVAKAMAKEMSEAGRGISGGLQESMLSLAEYSSLLYRLGFKQQQTMVKVYGHTLPSRDDVIEWVKGTTLNVFKQQLSADAYEDFLKEYRTRLFHELPDEKPFFYPFKRVLLWGAL